MPPHGVGLRPHCRPQGAAAPPAAGESRDAVAEWLADARGNQWYRCSSGLTICTQPAGWITDYVFAAGCAAGAASLQSMDEGGARPYSMAKFLWSFGALGLSGALIHHLCWVLVRRVGRGQTRLGAMDAPLLALWSAVLSICGANNYYLFATASLLWCDDEATAAEWAAGAVPVYAALALAVAASHKILIHIGASLPTVSFFAAACAKRIGTPHPTAPLAPHASDLYLGAALLLVAGGVVTKFKLSASRAHFNHNAVMHAVATAAVYCFYTGARADADAGLV
eukprot:TRINITY_DN10152_c0_g1_i1.p1 TRINITY_DN10152_c0_g1~~TRINITY_DN10152_c0_g1_i1.p1  ORF type:complete len:282 (+),score=48.61 TRINITY_DN10152_c0_g1_i1:107-952(+)